MPRSGNSRHARVHRRRRSQRTFVIPAWLYADPEVMRGVALFVEVAGHLGNFAEVAAVAGG